ncbi:YqiA/YcfP family alpha/beta fold hydrolase [Diaphorobacter aerolatus]|uniref:Esterase n=1 Tax=Diaphorobacter aerolatus TaxID=1288495 RepID=A0A7H0GHI1_9BURK|nr:YqiA/YcfP family alpha/beta fold hydrolase [Diaphorobacter aerolatus]QNP47747.1 esterase [Diaphorobacter aerolatus]
MPTTHLLYLHGFRSSPQSAKAQMTAAHVTRAHPKVHFWCPQLPPSPAEAMAMVAEGTSHWPREATAVIGSSLGGFYASWFAQQRRCRSVMLNPAVNPARDLLAHVGDQTVWHNPSERFYFQPHFVAELEALDVRHLPPAAPEMAIIAKGDELLDWREMAERYALAELHILEGGDHALSQFESYVDAVIRFCDPV